MTTLHDEFQKWYSSELVNYGMECVPLLFIRGFDGCYINYLVQISYNGFIAGYEQGSQNAHPEYV